MNLVGRHSWTTEQGRQTKKWIDVVKCNMVDVENRTEWRREAMTDPNPRDLQPEGERDFIFMF